MIANLFHHLRLAATGLTLALVAHGAAHAGLIRGDWDPAFGTALPGLSWTARTDLLVPDACSSQPDGDYTTNSGPCANSVVLGVFLRLYNTGYSGPLDWNNLATYFPDPNQAQSFSECNSYGSADPYYAARCGSFFGVGFDYYGVSNIRILGGNVVGFESNVPFGLTYDTTLGNPSGALANGFSLNFTLNGPVFTCVGNPVTQECNGTVLADTTDLTQFLVTYLSVPGCELCLPSDNSNPKFTDSNGNPLGVVLDGSGGFVRFATSVPEPGTLALLFAALTAVGWSRRRRV